MSRFLICLLAWPSLLFAQPAEDLIRRYQASLRSHQSVRYESALRFKFASETDTLSRRGSVMLYRLPGDTLFGGCIRLAHDSTLALYDGTFIYVANTASRKATRYRAHEGQEWAMEGNTTYRMVWNGFLDPDVYDRYAEPDVQLRRGADSLIGGRSCYAFHISLPDDTPFLDFRRHLYLSADSLLPLLSWGSSRFQGEVQFDESAHSRFVFNRLRLRDFSAQRLLRGYEIEDYVPPTLDSYRLLDSGALAPPLAGLRYGDSLLADSVVFVGKWTLLDFWYSTCYPCIQAIPDLERLHEAFGSGRFQVIGVNHADNRPERLARLPAFLQHNPIRYPILLVGADIVEAYQIKVWPSFYLISPEGKVYQTFLGYSSERGKEFQSLVESLLSNP